MVRSINEHQQGQQKMMMMMMMMMMRRRRKKKKKKKRKDGSSPPGYVFAKIIRQRTKEYVQVSGILGRVFREKSFHYEFA